MAKQDNSTTNKYETRPPIITIMGHVDHGKTSILDYIRKTNIQAKEHGGITQHIGAYQVEHKGKTITFIDTPGHAAFSQMRSRGGKAADIVVLVVAADDGVMPQTKEAIKHAKAANVPIIVAINKVDLNSADINNAKQGLAQENVLVEDWGGDVVCVEVSATKGTGINDLLDAINVVAEMSEFHADSTGELEATIIEAKLDRQRGAIVTAIVRNGTLKIGDMINASGLDAKVKALINDVGKNISQAGPSTPVEILGFKEVPDVGDLIVYQGSELAELSIDQDRVEIIGQETKKTLSLILKSDTQGTLEAIKADLSNLVSEAVGMDYSIKFSRATTGDIADSDILFAQNTNSTVVGFNIKYNSSIQDLAEDLNVEVKIFNTIYELSDYVSQLLEGTASKDEAKIKGRAEVLKTFKLPSGDIIAGCKVYAGGLKPKQTIKIYDKNPNEITELDEPLYIGKIKKVKHGNNEVQLAGKNTECGLLLKPQYENISKGQWIEVS